MTFNEALDQRLGAGGLDPPGVPSPRRRARAPRPPGAAARSPAAGRATAATTAGRRPTDGAATPAAPRPARRRPTAAPTAVPQPESELNVYNWQRLHRRRTRGTVRGRSTGSRSTTTASPTRTRQIGKLRATARAAATTCRTRASTWIPSFIEQPASSRSSTTRCIPNIANLRRRVARPGLRPGQPVLRAVLPGGRPGYAWDPDKIPADLTSWDALWDAALRQPAVHARRHARVLRRRRLSSLGLDPNTTDLAELDQILGRARRRRSRSSSATRHDHIADMLNGVVDIAHCWSGDWIQMTLRQAEDRATSSRPRARSRATTRSWSCPGRSTRSPPTCGSTSTSTPQISADEHELHRLHGPERGGAAAASRSYIVEGSPDQPAGRAPGHARSSSSTCTPADNSQYLDRWTSLRAS